MELDCISNARTWSSPSLDQNINCCPPPQSISFTDDFFTSFLLFSLKIFTFIVIHSRLLLPFLWSFLLLTPLLFHKSKTTRQKIPYKSFIWRWLYFLPEEVIAYNNLKIRFFLLYRHVWKTHQVDLGHAKSMSKIAIFNPLLPCQTFSSLAPTPLPPCHFPKSDKLWRS